MPCMLEHKSWSDNYSCYCWEACQQLLHFSTSHLQGCFSLNLMNIHDVFHCPIMTVKATEWTHAKERHASNMYCSNVCNKISCYSVHHVVTLVMQTAHTTQLLIPVFFFVFTSLSLSFSLFLSLSLFSFPLCLSPSLSLHMIRPPCRIQPSWESFTLGNLQIYLHFAFWV